MSLHSSVYDAHKALTAAVKVASRGNYRHGDALHGVRLLSYTVSSACALVSCLKRRIRRDADDKGHSLETRERLYAVCEALTSAENSLSRSVLSLNAVVDAQEHLVHDRAWAQRYVNGR